MQRELQERAERLDEQKQEAEDLADSIGGQMEGRGTFDRRTRRMLGTAQEEIERLRIEVKSMRLLPVFAENVRG